MRPGDPLDKRKIQMFHILFGEIGEDATEEIRGQIAALTGDRSTKSLTEAQAWEILHGMFERLGRKNPVPIAVTWCPVYSPQKATLHGGNVAALPSNKQVWHLFHLLREAGINDPQAFFNKRFKLREGIIRTAREAGWVAKALREMRDRKQGLRTGLSAAP
ncbi:MAG: hypothetical protein FVQ81_13150 [Candidatus Glassbacteria bacterium]|nr:hypothetical protein [Candidatus Glassbacteria bacterium]